MIYYYRLSRINLPKYTFSALVQPFNVLSPNHHSLYVAVASNVSSSQGQGGCWARSHCNISKWPFSAPLLDICYHSMDREDLEIAAIARLPNDHSEQFVYMSIQFKDREEPEIATIARPPNDHSMQLVYISIHSMGREDTNKRRQSGTPSRHVRRIKSRSYEG